MKKWALGLAAAAMSASILHAEAAIEGLYLDQGVQASVKPPGLQTTTRLFYRVPLRGGGGLLWESTKVDLGFLNILSPAFDFAGAFVDIEPIAFFDISFSALFTGYFEALGFGYGELSGYKADFDGSARKALPAKDAAGYVLGVTPTLKFALGPIAALDSFRFQYFDVDGGEGYFYEAIGNCVVAERGVELVNDAYIVADLGGGVRVGLSDSYLIVPDSGYISHNVNIVGAFESRPAKGISLYGALLLGVYLQDRYLRYGAHVAGQAGLTLGL